MKRREPYSSVFSGNLNVFVTRRAAEGKTTRTCMGAFSIFDGFCVDHGIATPVFTQDMGYDWMRSRPNESDKTRENRIYWVNRLLLQMKEDGFNVHPTGTVRVVDKFAPHIYTAEETAKYFLAVDSYDVWRQPYFRMVLPILFRVLLGCGTRLHETLMIRKEDVDLEIGTLRLRETKTAKERIVAMPANLSGMMAKYAEKCFFLKEDQSCLFSKPNGEPIRDRFIYGVHRNVLQLAGIPFIGGGKGPRVHDWRHTFAVRAYKHMHDSGMDMYVSLPVLSTYLGHSDIIATERYVRIAVDAYPYLEDSINKHLQEITKEAEA